MGGAKATVATAKVVMLAGYSSVGYCSGIGYNGSIGYGSSIDHCDIINYGNAGFNVNDSMGKGNQLEIVMPTEHQDYYSAWMQFFNRGMIETFETRMSRCHWAFTTLYKKGKMKRVAWGNAIVNAIQTFKDSDKERFLLEIGNCYVYSEIYAISIERGDKAKVNGIVGIILEWVWNARSGSVIEISNEGDNGVWFREDEFKDEQH